MAYERTLAHPTTLPLYYSAEDWMIATWWRTPAEAVH
jgi:microcin C transport system substrate-binding protein